MEIPPTCPIHFFFYPPTDLIFAVVADVVHAHEDRQKFPVLFEVQTLEQRQAEGVRRRPGICREQLDGASLYLETSQRVNQVSGLTGEVAITASFTRINARKPEDSRSRSPKRATHKVLCPVTARLNPVSLM